jgi:hypothetical protein
MRALVLSDAHGRYEKMREVVERVGVDVVVMCGDITNFGPLTHVKHMMEILKGRKVIGVGGNCDPPEIHQALEEEGAIPLHRRVVEMGDVLFMGIGGSNPTPFSTPFEMSEDSIRYMLEELLSKIRDESRTTCLVSHAPPYGVCDVARGEHVGSKAI